MTAAPLPRVEISAWQATKEELHHERRPLRPSHRALPLRAL